MKVTKSCLIAVRTRVSYRCLWVFNNSEPVKNWIQWEGSTWWRTHKKLCCSMIILRYRGGNTRHKIKVKVGLVYWSIEDNYFDLSEKGEQRRTIMVGTTVAKGQILDIRWTYTKGIINLREALMIRSTWCPWAWTQVQGRLPLLQCITFHLLLAFDEVVVLKFYLAKYQKSMTRENFRVHTV